MKKNVLNISLILLLASTGSVFAQQGFGTNRPAQSAAVDIVSPNKGLLIPRVALQANNLAAPITSPETSLIVYNTTFNAANNLKQGFYFWEGTKWEPFTTATTDLNTTNVSLAVVAGELVLTDSDGHPVKVDVADLDKQQITTFTLGTDHKVTLTLERGGTKEIDLSPYFNSTKLANGTNTTVSGTGTATDQYKVNVATATESNLGVVQIGSGINVTNGVISVPAAPGETTTIITDALTGTNKHKIADYKNESANAPVNVYETVTNLTQDASGITYVKEDGTSATAKVVSANSGNLVATGTDFGAFLEKSTVQSNQVKYEVIDGINTTASLDPSSTTDLQKYKVDVATANARTLGVVRQAETNPTVNVTNGDLSINLTNTVLAGEVTGPLNATIVADNVIDAANLMTDAVVTTKIANANVTPVKIQPATTFTQTQVMVTGTDGAVKWVDQSTISPATTVSNTSPDNTLITTVNGVPSTSVDLVKTVGLSLTGSNLTATVNGVSNAVALDLSGIDTDKQNVTDLSLTGNTLSISLERGNTKTVDLSAIDTNTDNQTLAYDNATKKLSIARGNDVDLSALAVDKDEQQLSLTGNTLSISNGNDVDLAKYLDNKDEQKLTYNETTKTLTLERGGAPIVLNGIDTNSKAVVEGSSDAKAKVVVTPTTDATTDTKTYKVEVKNAMPTFFYMPSVLINTSAATGSVNLYTTYTTQFGSPLVSSGSAEAGGIPTLTAKELDFYVTYYDNTVINNIVIDVNGNMTYNVIGAPTNLSFVNVVFKVRTTPKP